MSFDQSPSRERSRPKGTALQYAVKLLSVKNYSEKKLRDKLLGRQFTEGEITGAIARLQQERLLDDRRFAEEFVRARLAVRPRSGVILLRDLLQRGVGKKLAQEVIADLAPKENDEALARELVRRKLPMYSSLDEQTRRRRLMSLLARRGFSYETIGRVLPYGKEADDEDVSN
jgi:regulatory protein